MVCWRYIDRRKVVAMKTLYATAVFSILVGCSGAPEQSPGVGGGEADLKGANKGAEQFLNALRAAQSAGKLGGIMTRCTTYRVSPAFSATIIDDERVVFDYLEPSYRTA